jgi:hypothetical protein
MEILRGQSPCDITNSEIGMLLACTLIPLGLITLLCVCSVPPRSERSRSFARRAVRALFRFWYVRREDRKRDKAAALLAASSGGGMPSLLPRRPGVFLTNQGDGGPDRVVSRLARIRTMFLGPKYVGGSMDGRRQGEGELVMPSGDRYKGRFDKDKRFGFGECFYSGGDYYCGEWMNDMRHGTGYAQFALGGEYRGGWVAVRRQL